MIFSQEIRILHLMHSKFQFSLAALILIFFSPTAHAAGNACIDWPKTMAQYELDHPSAGTVIHIQSFSDYTKKGGDEWLSFGIRDYLTDLLQTGRGLKVLSGTALAYGALTYPSDYTLGGMYKHTDNLLQIFISINDKAGTLIRQIEVAVPYPENRLFFKKIADAAKQIMEVAGTKPDKKALQLQSEATASTRAYESYSKGREALESFSIGSVELASMWFTDVKRIDYRSPLGYLGMVDLYSFLGFYHKQRREPFGIYFQKAETEINEMRRLAKEKPPDATLSKSQDGKVANRFLQGNIAFSEALAASQVENWDSAVQSLKRAVELVPEDAISWYYLAQNYLKLGNSVLSSEAMQKARAINGCIE